MLLKSLIPFIVAALLVCARPHNGRFWTPGSARAPLALHKVNQRPHLSEPKPAGPPPQFQAVPPFEGNRKIQAILERERRDVSVEMPSDPVEDSAVTVGREEAGWGRRSRRKRSLTDDLDVQELRTTPEQIVHESDHDSSPIEVKSSLDGAPILEKGLRHNTKKSFQTPVYKTPESTDKTGQKDSYPVKGYGKGGDSAKGANNGILEAA